MGPQTFWPRDAYDVPCAYRATGKALAHAPAHVWNACRAVRREPVAAAVVDGPQADRRDDDLRPRGGEPSARDPGVRPRSRAGRVGPRSAHPQDAGRSWQKLGKNGGAESKRGCLRSLLGGGDKGDRTPDLVNAIIA